MRRKKTKAAVAKPIAHQPLEQRVLLDAAAAATLADAATNVEADTKIDNALQQLTSSNGLSAAQQDDSSSSEIPSTDFVDDAFLVGPQPQTREIFFIDTGVSNYQDLISEISPNASIFLIDTATDGVKQIRDILANNYADVDAIHIISHGDQGRLNLGSSELTTESISGEYADALIEIGSALAEHGDILIYGCDFASGAEGEAAAEALASLTGADVAASTDDTGAATHGGDWDLEHQTGDLNVRNIQAVGFDGILADTDDDTIDDANDLDDDNDGILDTDEGFVPATTVPINSANLNSPGFTTDTDLSNGNTAQLNGLFGGELDFEAELIGAGAPAFQANGDIVDNFFNENQFSFGFGLQNTTGQAISDWAVEIANANYNLTQSQFTNSTAFNLVTTTNPDGTFNHLFVGNVTIPANSGVPGGAFQINGVNFGFNPTSAGLVTGSTVAASGPSFADGVQVQNDPALGGDFIFIEAEGLGNFPTEFAEQTFNFNTPVNNLSFATGSINFNDTVIYEAFFQGASVCLLYTSPSQRD